MSEYNGWTNYATWRINLEMVDYDIWTERIEENEDLRDVNTLANEIEQNIADYLTEESGDIHSLVYSYAMSFIEDVNWREIAEGILEDIEPLEDEEDDDEDGDDDDGILVSNYMLEWGKRQFEAGTVKSPDTKEQSE